MACVFRRVWGSGKNRTARTISVPARAGLGEEDQRRLLVSDARRYRRTRPGSSSHRFRKTPDAPAEFSGLKVARASRLRTILHRNAGMVAPLCRRECVM